MAVQDRHPCQQDDSGSKLGDAPAFSTIADKAGRVGLHALLVRLSNAGLAYGVQIFLARLLGVEEYGIFAFAWVCLVLLGHMASFGFSMSSIRLLPAFQEENNISSAREFLGLALGLPLLVSIVLAGGLALAAFWGWLPVDRTYAMPIMVAALCLPLFTLQDIFEGIARAHHWVFLALVPTYLLRHGLLAVFACLLWYGGAVPTAEMALLSALCGTIVAFLLQGIMLWQRLRTLYPATQGRREVKVRAWLAVSVPLAFQDGALLLTNYADILVLSFFVSPAEIGLYFAVTRISQLMAFVRFAASAGTANLFSSLYAKGDFDGLARLAQRTCMIALAVSGAFGLALSISGPYLLMLFGSGFEAGLDILIILLVGLMVQAIFAPAEDVLNMTGHQMVTAWSYGTVVVLNITLNLVLIPLYGLVGAAIATAASMSLRAIYLSLSVKRRLRFSLWPGC